MLLRGPRHVVGFLLEQQGLALGWPIIVVSTLFLTRLLLRRRWLAILATVLVFTLLGAGGENRFVDVPFSLFSATVLLFTLLRFGVLGLAFCTFCAEALGAAPLTLDFSLWYAGHGLFLVAVFLAVVGWAFHVSLGGRPAFGGPSLDD